MAAEQKREFFPALEGIRGWAFLLVFLIHYTFVAIPPKHGPHYRLLYVLFLLMNTAWFLVPIFFVLSGFLITRILLNTRDHGGYFKVFYLRRAVRVLPLYYLTIGIVAVIMLVQHFVPDKSLFLYLIYLQNFSHVAMDNLSFPPGLVLTHLWSMAVEEQFYLLWPVAVYFLRTEKSLLRFIWGSIAVCFAFRFAWPLLHEPAIFAYYPTVTRGDAIMLGAWLAIEYRRKKYWDLLVRFSRVAAPLLWAAVIVIVMIRSHALAGPGYFEVTVLYPIMNAIAMSFVVLAIHPIGWVNRVCSGRAICWLGSRSYSLYLFHGIYSFWFLYTVFGRLLRHMSFDLAVVVMIGSAFLLTLGLAMLSYRFIEEPGMRLKDKFPYTKRQPKAPTVAQEATVPEMAAASQMESVTSSS